MRDVVKALSVKEFTPERDCTCPICMDAVAAAPGAWQVPKGRGTTQDTSEPSTLGSHSPRSSLPAPGKHLSSATAAAIAMRSDACGCFRLIAPFTRRTVGLTVPLCVQVLPCSHGVCTRCFETLVAREARLTTCPLCRERILKPSPEDLAAAASASAAASEAAANAPPTATLVAVPGQPLSFEAARRSGATDLACSSRGRTPASGGGGGGSGARQQQGSTFGGLSLADYGILPAQIGR